MSYIRAEAEALGAVVTEHELEVQFRCDRSLGGGILLAMVEAHPRRIAHLGCRRR